MLLQEEEEQEGQEGEGWHGNEEPERGRGKFHRTRSLWGSLYNFVLEYEENMLVAISLTQLIGYNKFPFWNVLDYISLAQTV